MTDQWITIDFKPAPAGWRVVYLNDADDHTGRHILVQPMPGWLIERSTTRPNSVRVVATYMDFAEPIPVDTIGNYWRTIGPDERVPTMDDAFEEWRDRNPDAELTGWPALVAKDQRDTAERNAKAA